jgi:hypothetical protein
LLPWSQRWKWGGWVLVPITIGALGLLLLVARLSIEWQWFGEFGAQGMVLRRWLLQLAAFLVVMGLGVPLQLQQLQRCWRLRLEAPRKQLPPSPLLGCSSWTLVGLLGLLLLLLVAALNYLMVQARDLIAAPFSGHVTTGIPVFADLQPLLLVGLAIGLLFPLLRWPLTTLRIALAAALAGWLQRFA